jgi:hypothetical protein
MVQIRVKGSHPEFRQGIAPNTGQGLSQSGRNMHKTGIVGYYIGRFFQNLGAFKKVQFTAQIQQSAVKLAFQ